MTDQNIADLRREADDRRDAIARDVELVTDRVAPGRIADRQKAKVRRGFEGVRDTVFGTSDRHRSDVDNHDESLRDKASGALEHAKEASPGSVGEFAEGNPLAAGLIGLGIGLLAAALIPSTREERQVADRAQEALDTVAGEVARVGQNAAEAVKPAAQDAVDDVKSSAHDSLDTVKDDAQSAADDVKHVAQDTADEVRTDH